MAIHYFRHMGIATLLRHSLIWSCLAVLYGTAHAADCVNRGQYLYTHLSQTPTVMEPRGWVARIFRESVAALQDCPTDEAIWYVLLRSLELVGDFPFHIEGIEVRDLRTAADLGSKRVSTSVRVATVRARAWHTTDTARAAVTLDPTYAPARIALASVLIDQAEAHQARTILEKVSDLNHVPGGYTLLARSRLLTDDFEGAISAAAQERSSMLSTLEPSILPDITAVRDAREVAGQAYLAEQKYTRAAESLLDAAVRGSDTARLAIVRADPPLRVALTRLLNSPYLPHQSRAFLRDLLRR
jgi:hypothetical protein